MANGMIGSMARSRAVARVLGCLLWCAVVHAGEAPVANVDGARIAAARQEPGNWLVAAGGYDEQRFSALEQINDRSVGTLGLAWYYDVPTQLGQEATPVVVDGVMYVATDGSIVKAFDARGGTLLWSFDPHALPAMVDNCCGPNNRGVAVWQGRVYVGTLDGHLIALDARNGKPVWNVQTVDRSKPYTVSGVPRIVNGKVIIGNGGAELGVRGYITAYDAVTGRQLWRFYTVPGDPARPDHAASDAVLEQKARKTWNGEYWKRGGGGTAWDSMAYDPALNLLYVGTGNGSPWNPAFRSPGGGDNLFLSSIVALDADTGAYRWHYQTTPEDAWDYTATQSIILADLPIGGRVRQVLMQAPKNGFYYVLDRKTGELLSADKFAPVTWASGVDLKTGRPIENPVSRYYRDDKPALVQPGSAGAHNWHSMSYSPLTRLAYLPVSDLPMVFATDPDPAFGSKKTNVAVVFDGSVVFTPEQLAQIRGSMKGWLSAWDPVARREAWRVPLSHHWNGGTLATAGNLVFQGNGAAEFAAYDARTGKRLWVFDAQTGIVAAPMSFAIDGHQYIAVMAGWAGSTPLLGGGLSDMTGRENGPNRLLVFALGGKLQLPPEPARPALTPVLQAEAPAPEVSVKRGGTLYGRYCFRCHGIGALGGGLIRDLRTSPYIAARESFVSVLVKGVLEPRGMTSFGEQIGADGAEAIRAWLLQRARDLHQEQQAPAGAGAPAQAAR